MKLKNSASGAFGRYWPVLAISLIVILGIYVRTLDYRWPYLRNIDSYNFFSEMEDILENNGKLSGLDELKLAPDGSLRSGNIFSYWATYSFILYSKFFPSLQLWQFMIWFPAFAAALLAIPMYFIVKNIYDRKAGVIAAFLMVFETSIVARTLGGDPDNDSIVLLMPLMIIAAFLITYKYIQKNGFGKKAAAYSVVTGILFAAWIFSWGGYWYVAWLMFGFIFLLFVSRLASSKSFKRAFGETKNNLLSIALIFAVAMLIITVHRGPNVLGIMQGLVQGPFQFGDIKAETGQFPNVYVSVAELQAPSGPREVIQRIGPSFFIMLSSILYLFYSYAKKRAHLDTIILLGIWFIGPFLATVAAVRFSILFSAPVAIGSGIIFSKIIRLITGEDSRLED